MAKKKFVISPLCETPQKGVSGMLVNNIFVPVYEAPTIITGCTVEIKTTIPTMTVSEGLSDSYNGVYEQKGVYDPDNGKYNYFEKKINEYQSYIIGRYYNDRSVWMLEYCHVDYGDFNRQTGLWAYWVYMYNQTGTEETCPYDGWETDMGGTTQMKTDMSPRNIVSLVCSDCGPNAEYIWNYVVGLNDENQCQAIVMNQKTKVPYISASIVRTNQPVAYIGDITIKDTVLGQELQVITRCFFSKEKVVRYNVNRYIAPEYDLMRDGCSPESAYLWKQIVDKSYDNNCHTVTLDTHDTQNITGYNQKWILVDLKGGQQYQIGIHGTDYDERLLLYKADNLNNWLKNNDDDKEGISSIDGVSIVDNDAAFYWTPDEDGQYYVVPAAYSGTGEFTVHIYPEPIVGFEIKNQQLVFKLGIETTKTLVATIPDGITVIYEIISGTLPNGITFNDGVFSGTIATEGESTLVIGYKTSDNKQGTITVNIKTQESLIQQDTVFLIDASQNTFNDMINNIIPEHCSSEINNEEFVFGNSSGKYIRYNLNSISNSVNFGTNKDFTIETVARMTQSPNSWAVTFVNTSSWQNGCMMIQFNRNGNRFSLHWNGVCEEGFNTYHDDYFDYKPFHLALTRRGSVINGWVNGVKEFEINSNSGNANFDLSNAFFVGHNAVDGGYFNGNIKWLKISNTCKYTENFDATGLLQQ